MSNARLFFVVYVPVFIMAMTGWQYSGIEMAGGEDVLRGCALAVFGGGVAVALRGK